MASSYNTGVFSRRYSTKSGISSNDSVSDVVSPYFSPPSCLKRSTISHEGPSHHEMPNYPNPSQVMSKRSRQRLATANMQAHNDIADSQWSCYQEAMLKRQSLEKLADYPTSSSESFIDPSASTICHDLHQSNSRGSLDPYKIREGMLYHL